MPLFEFVCTTCEKDFEELVRSADRDGRCGMPGLREP